MQLNPLTAGLDQFALDSTECSAHSVIPGLAVGMIVFRSLSAQCAPAHRTPLFRGEGYVTGRKPTSVAAVPRCDGEPSYATETLICTHCITESHQDHPNAVSPTNHDYAERFTTTTARDWQSRRADAQGVGATLRRAPGRTAPPARLGTDHCTGQVDVARRGRV